MNTEASLKRTLGIWGIVGLGLGYMTPTVVFDTFGIVSRLTDGVVPLAYLVGLVVMIFTAISYGKMVQVYPDAGSAYTYTRRTMGEHLGFFVGWTSLLDYLLLPMVNALIIRIYMESLFPEVPVWIWVVVYVAFVTAINIYSMQSTSNLNGALVIMTVTLMGVFLIIGSIKLYQGFGNGTIFTTEPLWHMDVAYQKVLAGATVVAFSFIGFDAITMYTEEAKDQKVVPRAITLTVLIGGAIFFVAAYFIQSLFPDPSLPGFTITDDTLPEIALFVGGKVFQLIFLLGAIIATTSSGLASHASVSRLLYVMGRSGALPKRLFGYVSPRFHTPVFTIVLTGIVSLAAIGPDLELIASVINFGALIAFTFVNLSVIAYFAFHKKRYHTLKDIFHYIVMPVLGALFTGVLWAYLQADAFIGGVIWIFIGLIYVIIATKGFRKKLSVEFDEEVSLEKVQG